MTDVQEIVGLDAVELERQVWERGGSTGMQLLVETALARRYLRHMGKSYATVAKIHQMTGISRPTVKKCLDKLVASGRWRQVDTGSYAPVRTRG